MSALSPIDVLLAAPLIILLGFSLTPGLEPSRARVGTLARQAARCGRISGVILLAALVLTQAQPAGAQGQVAWVLLSPSASPPPRYLAAMAYDAATSRVLLFGGDGPGGILGDTWAWDGTTWTELSPPTSPSPRSEAAMAYDPSTSQLLLFGGVNGGYLGDTWAWDGTTWTELSPPPAPRPASLQRWPTTRHRANRSSSGE